MDSTLHGPSELKRAPSKAMELISVMVVPFELTIPSGENQY